MKLPPLPESHREAVAEAVAALVCDPGVRALALVGSLARGDALPGSDIDLLMIVADEGPVDVPHAVLLGCVVEQHRYTLSQARDYVATRPAHVYLYLESVVLHDPEDLFPELVAMAEARRTSYRLSARDVRLTRFWLLKVRSKLLTALETGDSLLAGYLAATTGREIVSDLFALAGRPPPASGSAYARLGELTAATHVRALFDGDSMDRARAAVHLIERILAELPEC